MKFVEWAAETMDRSVPLGVAAWIVPENLFPPVPWMDRHGCEGVFFGRMAPGVSSLISPSSVEHAIIALREPGEGGAGRAR